MGIWNFFRKKKENDLEQVRREKLLLSGRITDGRIIDCETTETGEEIVYYFYSVQGTDYESSQILNEEQLREPLKYAPGAKVGIRFDHKHHGNSMLI
jgi:hypothetical protein